VIAIQLSDNNLQGMIPSTLASAFPKYVICEKFRLSVRDRGNLSVSISIYQYLTRMSHPARQTGSPQCLPHLQFFFSQT
jgi:hypothetical protein